MIDVLYDHEIFAMQPVGGISRYFAELLPRLGEHGVAADLFLGLHISRFDFPRERLARVTGARRWPRRGTTKLTNGLNRAWFRSHARRRPPQIYHSTSYRDDLAGDSRFDDALRVVTVHDLIDFRVDGRGRPKSMWSVAHAALRRVDGWICISENTRRDLLELFPQIDPTRTRVIHHASDLKFTGQRSPPARPYVLHVGGRSGYKNFAGLVNAFARSPRLSSEFDLLAFGWPPSNDERARLARPNVRLRFASGDDAALAAAYANATAFVYPSLYEGFGLPLLEATRCDCPIACSETSCFPEISGDAAAYFDPRDPSSIAAAIESIVFDESRRRSLVERGRLRQAAFSWDRAAAETADFYRAILGHHGKHL